MTYEVVVWTIILTGRFEDWFDEQDISTQKKILADLSVLEVFGPQLGRPVVDSLYGSKFNNMKELKIQCKGRPIRAFFAFDPLRRAIVLCAGDKTGNEKHFYKEMISVADAEYEAHLASLEGKNENS
ncbi:type II toxin-antitoxin system RelE/ParE family toxin [Photorhabdus laumondii]|uniref:type II toxin-antitoxin system RelE/ParE family toxin n=1 Tax=Photorhabdus laumondii TaxID=2218628 RepID=UPI003D9C9CE9